MHLFTYDYWVDIAVGLLCLYYLIAGWRRGFFLGIIDLFGMLTSFVVAIQYYPFVAQYVMTYLFVPKGVSYVGSFFLIGIVVQMIFSLFVEYVSMRVYARVAYYLGTSTYRKLFTLDTIFGCIPALMEAGLMAALFLTTLLVLPISGVVKRSILDSFSGPYLVMRTQRVERDLNLLLGEAVHETLTFLTVNPDPISEESIELGFTFSQGVVHEKAEYDMIEKINEERKKRGIPELQMDESLRELARTYARDLFARGYFSHQSPEGKSPFDRMNDAKIPYGTAGENLALAPDVTLAHQGLMNSPGHRANILLPEYTRVGIGVIDGGIYGQMYVQEFTD